MPVVFTTTDGKVGFWCPGCETYHAVDQARWHWNGDRERPTLSPSLVVELTVGGRPSGRCHSFVKEGRIQFLGDCTHALAGQTVPIPVDE